MSRASVNHVVIKLTELDRSVEAELGLKEESGAGRADAEVLPSDKLRIPANTRQEHPETFQRKGDSTSQRDLFKKQIYHRTATVKLCFNSSTKRKKTRNRQN